MEVIEIRSGWDGELLYRGKHTDVKEAAEAAVKVCSDLSRADLSGANLASANLNRAYLASANLSGANLASANLSGANLSGANLASANLAGANLASADLSGANLAGANLSRAYLAGAKVGAGGDEARLVGSRPIVQIGPIGSRNDWLTVFWCGDSGMRISTGCQNQITEHRFLERLKKAHGEGEQANIHAKHYIEALAFAKTVFTSKGVQWIAGEWGKHQAEKELNCQVPAMQETTYTYAQH